jgi:sugar/nucleoside kinase (ribokinase family)
MKGLFAGLSTIDIQYVADRYPHVNTKTLVSNNAFYLGGPAANAAITFSNLGGDATLATSVGKHLFTEFILGELHKNHVKLFDVSAFTVTKPVISAVITSGAKGDRTVLTTYPEPCNAEAAEDKSLIDRFCKSELRNYDIMLLDCFYISHSARIAREAKKREIPVVVDAGSWKNGMEELIEIADIVICSADFYPPGTKTRKNVFEYLDSKNTGMIAITRGEDPVLFKEKNRYGEIKINKVKAIDTLGAGDIFHGAFCFYFLKENNFAEALKKASAIATESCKYRGTRDWLRVLKPEQ